MAATRTITDEAQLRELIGLPTDTVLAKIADRLNDLTRQFIERSPFRLRGQPALCNRTMRVVVSEG